MKPLFAILLTGAFAAAAVTDASAAQKPQFVRGSVTSVTPASVVVKTASGPVTLAIGPKTMFVGASAGSQTDIVPGAFIGTANVPSKAGARALEVSVFDARLRGMGEGDYPWQAANDRTSSMTNGTVGSARRSSMTNGTVASAGGGGAKTIVVRYHGGSKTIVIPADAPVVRVAPGSAKLLAPGASIFAAAVGRGGSLAANFAVVGRNGTVVPL